MPELRTLLDREARDFDLPPDLWDRTRRIVNRRQRHRRVSASLVALAVAVGGFVAAWAALSPTRHGIAPGSSGSLTGGSSSGPTASPSPSSW
jgi:hypothetical protein